MALKASQLKVGDTHVERVAENLSRTQIVNVPRRLGRLQPAACGRGLCDAEGPATRVYSRMEC